MRWLGGPAPFRPRVLIGVSQTNLGSVLYEFGDTGQAVEPLQRAIRLDPDEARAHDYLGRALWAEGRFQEAELHRRRAAELAGSLWPPAEPRDTAKTRARPPGIPVEPAAGGFRPSRRRVWVRRTPRPGPGNPEWSVGRSW